VSHPKAFPTALGGLGPLQMDNPGHALAGFATGNPVPTSPPRDATRADPLILVQEISHRVVNEYTHAIAAIRLAAADIPSVAARTALLRTAAALRDFAEAHRALQAPDTDARANLGEYLERLCSAITTATLRDRGIRLTLATEPVLLPADRCWRVALIVSELITNAARHGLKGGSGEILVEIEDAAGEVICRVGDNGRPDATRAPSRGMSVVRGLAAELGGVVAWRFTADGATAELTFPRDASGWLA
jgi:two-component sensor histidine kinase